MTPIALPPIKTHVISKSGTRHLIGIGPSTFKVYGLCGFGVDLEDERPASEATRDCQFCELQRAEDERLAATRNRQTRHKVQAIA